MSECPVCGGTMVWIAGTWYICNACAHEEGQPPKADAEVANE
jgi:hypothetical protein